MSYNHNPNAAIEASTMVADQETRINQLKKHRQLINQIKAKDTNEANFLHTNPDKVTRQQNVGATKQKTLNPYKPKFQWEKIEPKTNQKDTTFEIIPTEKTNAFNSLNELDSTSNHMLTLFGYQIDLSSQVDQLQKKLQKFFIESKSHNPLIGKFSDIKCGMMMAILSLLGVEPNTLDTLKKEALKKAIQDNLDCFEQNEYNFELITIFSVSKKDRGRKMVLEKLRNQLMKQMTKYTNDTFYTKEKIATIKQDQVRKILGDLLEEKQNLMYVRNFQ